ncbi:type II restriction endonuclease [Micromonospora sp. NPDC049047]|uniref:type II restriction endonuclease n=1 Tax=Micromonospora sp. NPDC049047 TaxID=3155645 RepID=UPI0033E78C36
MGAINLIEWLRDQCGEYRYDLEGVFRRDSTSATWPVTASNPAELGAVLTAGGHLLPLPKESAALANVLEVSVVDFLLARLSQVDGAEMQRGSERGYPDLEIGGPAFGGGLFAVDVKSARREDAKKTRERGHEDEKTQSRITLYTGNTYFRHPDLHWPGTFRPFNEYEGHLDLILIYTLNPDSRHRVEDLEVIVQEPWRIASKDRSSTTREYIGAVEKIVDLRMGKGAFATAEAFYKYWRAYHFKVSAQVQKQYERALAEKMRELEQYKAAHQQDPA